MSAQSRAARFHRLLLRAFPRAFRDRFGADMDATFRARVAARGAPSPAEWLRIAADLLLHGALERIASVRIALADALLDSRAATPRPARTMDMLRQDLRFALRTFASHRTTTLLAILVLATGIGLNTAIFSVVESVLLRSLPYREPERLMGIGATQRERRDGAYQFGSQSRFAYETWNARRDVFEDVAGYRGEQPIATGLGDPVRLTTWSVTPNFFHTLGATPALGRAIVADDSLPGAPPVLVASYDFWQTRLGGDPNAIGRAIVLDAVPHVIVGVMPRSFRVPADGLLWRAFMPARASERERADDATHDVWGGFYVIGRLRRGVTPAIAMQRLDAAIAQRAATEREWDGLASVVVPMHRQLTAEVRRPLLLVLEAVGLVLLVACANVGNLQLARVSQRADELSLRVAVGAPRGRLLRQLLTESVLLALAGGAIGVMLAYLGVPLLVRLAGDELPAFTHIGVDLRVLGATVLASMASGVAFGIAPALVAVRRANPETMRTGAARTATHRNRLGDVFVVAQLALTVVLLAGAGLLVTSFERLTHVDIGFDPDRVIVAQLQNSARANRVPSTVLANVLVERVRAVPGVAAVAVSSGTPLSEGALLFGITAVGGVAAPPEHSLVVHTSATPEFFRTLGIRLLRGRLFADGASGKQEVVVSEALARLYYPNMDAMGQRLRFFGKSTEGTIVGIVSDTKALALDEAAPPKIYQAFTAVPTSYMSLVVRAQGEPAALVGAIRAAVREVDPGLPLDKIDTMRGKMATSVVRQRFYTTLLSIFATVAMLMAAAGLYAVINYMVARRTRELGVRVALGARSWDVRRLVLGRSARIAVAGAALGVGGAAWATRALRGMLYDVTPGDPRVLAAVVAVLAGVALLASWAPAGRAARVDPVRAIRSE